MSVQARGGAASVRLAGGSGGVALERQATGPRNVALEGQASGPRQVALAGQASGPGNVGLEGQMRWRSAGRVGGGWPPGPPLQGQVAGLGGLP